MGRSPRHPIWIGGPGAAVLLLGAAFAVTCILAWNAWRLTLAHQAVTDQTVEEYAQVALWEFNRSARWDLATATVRRSTAGLVKLCAHDMEPSLPSPHALPALLHEAEMPLLASGVQRYFRLDLNTDRLQMAGAPLGGASDLASRVRRHWEEGLTEGWQVGVVPFSAGTQEFLALYEVLGESDGTPRVLMGVITSMRGLDPVFRRVMDQVPLLPPSLLKGRDNQDMLAIALMMGDRTIWSSGRPTPEGIRVSETFAPFFPGTTTVLTLHPDAASTLLPEAGGPMGTATVIALLLTAGALLGVALLLLRREYELVRLRSDLVSGVSHELRTPLAQIRMFAETLYFGRARTEADERRSLRIISQESRRLAHLVDNVLLFAQARQGLVGDAHTETIYLLPFLQDVLDQFEPLANHREAHLQLVPHPGDVALDELAVEADPTLFRQLLLNLLDNAVKYGPEDQVVRLEVERPHPQEVVLRIRDEGPGIPMNEQRSIWNAFSRLPRDREGPVAGAGIGLSVVASVARAHGWTVKIEEPDMKPSGGSFVVKIPMIVPSTDPPSGSSKPEPETERPWSGGPHPGPAQMAQASSQQEKP